MKFVNEAGTCYLEEKDQRIALTPSELKMFRLMTPLGRKILLRQRAVERITSVPNDPEAHLILELFRLPAREWSFLVPD